MAATERARQLRKKCTWAEKLVWQWLRGRRFGGYKFQRQVIIGPYYLDFFCREARLSIELDGRQHGFPKQQQHDVERKIFLETLGIEELRFWNSHLRRDAEVIRNTIFEKLQERSARLLPDYTRPMPSRPATSE